MSTKEKILDTANELFAKYGFSGTSVRDIATEAGVNLSAINYHFENKQNLYCNIFQRNYETMSNAINKIGEDDSLDISDLAVKTSQYFMNNSSAMMNTFKIFLIDDFEFPEEMMLGEECSKLGPPGAEAFTKKIIREVGDGVSEEEILWAVSSIFSELVHMCVVLSTHAGKEKQKINPMMTPKYRNKAIPHHVKAVVEYLKNHPNFLKD